MTNHKIKFIKMKDYGGISIRFGNDTPCLVKYKGTIALYKKNCDYVDSFQDHMYNLLSHFRLNKNGYNFEFNKDVCKNLNKLEDLISARHTKHNIVYLSNTIKSYLVSKVEDSWL